MRRTKEQAEQTRQSLMQSALNLFASQGYVQTSLSQIASQAQLSRGAVYWHFASKTQLLQAIAEEHLRPIMASTQSALVHGQTWASLEHVLLDLFTEILRNTERQKFFKIVHEQYGASEDIRQIAQQYDQFFQTQSALLVAAGNSEGKIHDSLSADYVHLHLNALMTGLINAYLMQSCPFSVHDAQWVIRRTMASFAQPLV